MDEARQKELIERGAKFQEAVDALCKEYGFTLKVKVEVVREGVILADPVWVPTR
jgi:hypothetical protein